MKSFVSFLMALSITASYAQLRPGKVINKTPTTTGPAYEAKPDLTLLKPGNYFDNTSTGVVRKVSVLVTNKGDKEIYLAQLDLCLYGAENDVFSPTSMKLISRQNFNETNDKNATLKPGQTIEKQLALARYIIQYPYFVLMIDSENKIIEQDELNNSVLLNMQPPFQSPAVFYEHCDFAGNSISLHEGVYDLAAYNPWWIDKISSIRVPIGYEITIKTIGCNTEGSYRFQRLTTKHYKCLKNEDLSVFSDKIRCIEIKKTGQ